MTNIEVKDVLSKKPLMISLLVFVLGASVGLQYTSLAVEPASSCGCNPPCWCWAIMDNIEITGLINVGESQSIEYIGMSNWNSYDVCNYLVWRWHSEGQKRDLQAHIELGKISDGVYRLEIYHSWKTLSVSLPYNYKVIFDSDNILVLRIEDDVCPD
jgi:hypothetical protein